ncbi:MAG: hypothetical protein WC242_01180 [Candidatus Paceibacterota bacterium]|jgi:hypothetical protein
MTIVIGAEAAKMAGLLVDTLQKARQGQITLEQWEWFNGLTKEGRERFLRTIDPRYFVMSTFTFKVPDDYGHATQLAKFKRMHGSDFVFYNNDITDEHFAGVTTKLIPGKVYTVKLIGITSGSVVSSEDNLAVLRQHRAILVGAQGLSVVYKQAKEKFPKGKWVISLDEKDACWKDASGFPRVPFMVQCLVGGWRFNLDYFGGGWNCSYCLLCLCD